MLFQEGLELQAQRVILSAAKDLTNLLRYIPLRVLRCAQDDTLSWGTR